MSHHCIKVYNNTVTERDSNAQNDQPVDIKDINKVKEPTKLANDSNQNRVETSKNVSWTQKNNFWLMFYSTT